MLKKKVHKCLLHKKKIMQNVENVTDNIRREKIKFELHKNVHSSEQKIYMLTTTHLRNCIGCMVIVIKEI